MRRLSVVTAVTLAAAALSISACGTQTKDTASLSTNTNTASASGSEIFETPSETPSPSPTPSGPTHFQFGQPADISFTDYNDVETAATMTVGNPQATATEPGEFGQTAEKGTYVVFPLDVQATAPAGFEINTAYFYVRGSDGTHYDETIATGFGETLPLTNLHSGEKAHGVMVYDLPTGHGTLVFQGHDNQSIAEWDF